MKNNYPWLNWAVGTKTEDTRVFGSNHFEVDLVKGNATIVVLWQDANITAEHSAQSLRGGGTERREIFRIRAYAMGLSYARIRKFMLSIRRFVVA